MRFRRPEIQTISYVWVMSLAFCGMSVWISGFRFSSGSALVMGLAETTLLMGLFAFSSRGTRVWMGLGAVGVAASGVVVRNLGMEVSPSVFESIFQTHASEAWEFLTRDVVLSFLLYLIPLMGVVLLPSLKSDSLRGSLKKMGWSWVLALALILTPHGVDRLSASVAQKSEIRSFLLPFASVFNGLEFYRKREGLQIIPVAQRRAIEKEFRFELGWKPGASAKAPVFVLVIGESQRGDHLSLNGYERPTTPELERASRLVSYTDVWSCSTRTVFSVPCLLSHSGMSQFSLPVRETSLVSVMKSLGFETFWMSMHPKAGRPNCMEAEHCWMESDLVEALQSRGRSVVPHDERLVHGLEMLLKSRSPERPAFVVLHGMGSHFEYTERYPREDPAYQVFGSVCRDGFYQCDRDQIRNAYDHSLLYFDRVLSRLIEELESENSALLLTADHGESLGEMGLFAHGKPNFLAPREQRSVPLIFWSSETFSRWRDLERVFRNRIRRTPASHDFVFHSTLGCLGVQSEQIQTDKNLCSSL